MPKKVATKAEVQQQIEARRSWSERRAGSLSGTCCPEAHLDLELNITCAKDSVREEMKDRHSKELSMKDEIISLLKEKLSTRKGGSGPSSGGGSSNPKSVDVDEDPPKALEERTTSKKMTLPTLQKFSGDGNAFDRWLHKFSHYIC